MIDPKASRRPARMAVGLVALGALALSLASIAAPWNRGESSPPASTGRPGPVVAEPESRAARTLWARDAYQARCASCHGPGGRPDLAKIAFLGSKPSDLASIRWTASAAARVREAIVDGLPGTSMAAYGGSFAGPRVDSLVALVRSFAPESAAAMPTGLAARLEAAGFAPEPSLGPAPAVEMEAVDGARTSLSDSAGKLTLVVFWGTSCAPCLEEFPELERLADAYRGRGLAVLPVATNVSDPGSIRVAVDGRITHLPVFFARSPDTMSDYDLRLVPAAALIDRSGRLLGIARARTAWEKPPFRDLLEACLDPAPPAG